MLSFLITEYFVLNQSSSCRRRKSQRYLWRPVSFEIIFRFPPDTAMQHESGKKSSTTNYMQLFIRFNIQETVYKSTRYPPRVSTAEGGCCRFKDVMPHLVALGYLLLISSIKLDVLCKIDILCSQFMINDANKS